MDNRLTQPPPAWGRPFGGRVVPFPAASRMGLGHDAVVVRVPERNYVYDLNRMNGHVYLRFAAGWYAPEWYALPEIVRSMVWEAYDVRVA